MYMYSIYTQHASSYTLHSNVSSLKKQLHTFSTVFKNILHFFNMEYKILLFGTQLNNPPLHCVFSR